MSDSLFVDTNILVYAFESEDGAKQRICKEFIRRGFRGERVVAISNQVLVEFVSVITRGVEENKSYNEAVQVVALFIESQQWKKLDYTSNSVLLATKLAAQYRLSIWDALIAATMIENGISTIFTEDAGAFSAVPGFKVISLSQKEVPEK